MKQIVHENIKQMDISSGGGIFGEKARIDTINHPVLVLGLGGTGIDALLRLKYQVSRRFRLPENAKNQKPENIEYLALETNEHDRKKYRGMSLDPYTETVLLSNAGIGGILNNRSTLPEYISSWLNPDLTITDGTKGASGNRQAGRLLLFEKINTAIDAISNKIKSLRTDRENKLLVFVLSGVSGGTGGGMFLDIPYIVRGLMEREYGAKGIDKVEITGYLFTPDVHLAGNNMSIHTEEYIQRNGYAALKELDYFMNIEERAERFSQKYGTRLDVNSALPPFNLCHLISACNIDGVFLKNAYDYCMNVTAENIVNFLALEDKESGSEFAVQDYHSNLISNIAAMKSNLPTGTESLANFSYNIIGASAAVLPTEGLNAYLAHAIFAEMSEMFDAEPDDYELQEFAKPLEISALGAEFARRLPPIKLDYAETDYYSHRNVIKTRRVDVEEKLAEQFAAAKRELLKTGAGEIIERVQADLREIFTDPARGAFYTSRIIYSDTSPCILARIGAYQAHLREKIDASAGEIDAYEVAAEMRFEEAAKAIFAREGKKNAYIEAKIAVYQARLQKEIFLRLIDIYKEIHSALERENDKIYSVYAEILREVRKVFEKNAEAIATENENRFRDNANAATIGYRCPVLSVSDLIPEIEEMLHETGRESLIHDFLKSLLDNAPKWLSDAQLNITQAVSDFVYDKFGAYLTRGMSEFLNARHNGERRVDDIIETEISPQLYRDAKPIFHLDNAAGIFHFPAYGMVSVPKNAPEILRGIEAYQGHALANLRFNIRKSEITDRIFWLNTQNGIPLFAYAPIRVYEELYERTIETREGVGRHLVMNERENWTNLPSPLPEKFWGDTYTNPRQKALNDEAREVFKTATAHGALKKNWDEDFFIRCPNLINETRQENERHIEISKVNWMAKG
ncbi:MAG: tubulin-like doman-containing protein [Defluviitaleaceae bacterium]|nr:tubulin-like doman-containing protein [Defluviitaleaceae bacterium]